MTWTREHESNFVRFMVQAAIDQGEMVQGKVAWHTNLQEMKITIHACEDYSKETYAAVAILEGLAKTIGWTIENKIKDWDFFL